MTVDPTGAISDAVTSLSSSIGPIAVTGLGIGGTILAFTLGWRLVKRFAR